ncbi:MAG: sugar ABC transporter permease, partial [Lachnospiraceae bacterium]|nr:sugar ABC transporter permease [Lachnospiraceae bacterium]
MEKKKKGLGKKILGALQVPVKDCKEIGQTFAHGDWKTKVSFLIMGFGPLMRGQILRGIAFLATEIAFIWYMIAIGAKYLKDIGTLGTVQGGFDENYVYTYGDNSFFILLVRVMSLFVLVAFLVAWRIIGRVNMNEGNRL